MNFRLVRSLTFAVCAGPLLTVSAQSAGTRPNLMPYYTYYPVPGTFEAIDPPILGFPPTVRVIGGGVDPAPIVVGAGSFASIQRMLNASDYPTFLGTINGLTIIERRVGVCQNSNYAGVGIPQISGQQQTLRMVAEPPGPLGCRTDFISGEPQRWMTTDRVTFLAPVRRSAIDGSEYEASPMTLERGGVPWMTYYAGYRLGFVAGESNWVASNAAKLPELAGWPSFPDARDNFELAKLPPPFVEGEVVGYFTDLTNAAIPGGVLRKYAYAANTVEQQLFETSTAWFRTGQSFRSGGYVAVCSVSTGPALDDSTRMYSANDKECALLAASPVFPFAGAPIRASRPIPAGTLGAGVSCPAATVPLYRLYNNDLYGIGKGKGNGHRFLTSNAVRQDMIRFGGSIDEGVAMCVPQ